MPNWCENDLTVRGGKANLEDFQSKMRDEPARLEDRVMDRLLFKKRKILDENVLIPYPDNFKQLDEVACKSPLGAVKDGFNSGGYEWCIENWGTKWGFCQVQEPKIRPRSLVYHFNSAWSPPEPLILKMGELFPNLSFDLRYFEQGAGFQGHLVITKGKVISDEHKKYAGHRGG